MSELLDTIDTDLSWSTKPAFTSMQVCQLLNISYRQLHYRIERGYAKPALESTGSGVSHMWSLRNVIDLAVFEANLAHCPMGGHG